VSFSEFNKTVECVSRLLLLALVVPGWFGWWTTSLIHASKTTIEIIVVVLLGIVETHIEAWRLTESKAAGRVLVPTQIIQIDEATCEYFVSGLGSLLELPKGIG